MKSWSRAHEASLGHKGNTPLVLLKAGAWMDTWLSSLNGHTAAASASAAAEFHHGSFEDEVDDDEYVDDDDYVMFSSATGSSTTATTCTATTSSTLTSITMNLLTHPLMTIDEDVDDEDVDDSGDLQGQQPQNTSTTMPLQESTRLQHFFVWRKQRRQSIQIQMRRQWRTFQLSFGLKKNRDCKTKSPVLHGCHSRKVEEMVQQQDRQHHEHGRANNTMDFLQQHQLTLLKSKEEDDQVVGNGCDLYHEDDDSDDYSIYDNGMGDEQILDTNDDSTHEADDDDNEMFLSSVLGFMADDVYQHGDLLLFALACGGGSGFSGNGSRIGNARQRRKHPRPQGNTMSDDDDDETSTVLTSNHSMATTSAFLEDEEDGATAMSSTISRYY